MRAPDWPASPTGAAGLFSAGPNGLHSGHTHAAAPRRIARSARSVVLAHSARLVRGVMLALLLGGSAPGTAQTAPSADEARVAPEGPYRSRMRILDGAAQTPADAELPLPATPYAIALQNRASGYAAAARGDDRAAIEQLQAALAAGGLAPLAEQPIRADLVRLWLRLGDDDALLAAFSRWQADGHSLGDEEQVAVAYAAARAERFALARSAIEQALANRPSPPAAWRELQVYVLARDGAPLAAARVKSELMDMASATRADWLQLSTLYRDAGRDAEALAALELGYRAGRLDRASDVLALASAYRRGGLPRDAADLLAASLDTGVLPDEAQHWQRLADALLAAREDAAALAPLTRAVELAPEPALRFALGQLHYGLGQYAQASDTLRQALRGKLGADTGRAYLLLGEALLAQDRRREARRALREAADLGGSYREAQALLAALEGDGSADDTEAPAEDTGDAAADGTADIALAGDRRQGASGAVATKKVPRQRFYYTAEQVSGDTLAATVGEMIGRLRRAVRRERLTAAGPLQIIAPTLPQPGQKSELQVGIPVLTRTAPRGAFNNRDLQPWTCAWREYRGPANGLSAAWQGLLRDLAAAGLALDGETRTVVRDFAGGLDDTLFELQVGVLPASSAADGS